MGTWQPIETAPRDGTRILLYRAKAHASVYVLIGHWNTDRGDPYWTHDAEHTLGIRDARKFQPTHWMPLPEWPVPPTEDHSKQSSVEDHLNKPQHQRDR